MNFPNLYILDVGHGNSAILETGSGSAVFDAGRGNQLHLFLESKDICRLEYVVLSHADSDHVAGLAAILSGSKLHVDRIYANSDSNKSSDTWIDLVYLMQDAMDRGLLNQIVPNATPSVNDALSIGDVTVELLAPKASLALLGPGANDSNGKRITTNSMSVVVRLVFSNGQAVLLPGDIDQTGLEHLLSDTPCLTSDFCVFPHHGGLPGTSDVTEFVSLLHSAVSFQKAIFSVRGKKSLFPRTEVLDVLADKDPEIMFFTTQESDALRKREGESHHVNGIGTLHLSVCGNEIAWAKG